MSDTSTKKRKLRPFAKIGASILVVAGLGAAMGGGTFASFNAQVRNPGNQFANGPSC